MPDPDGTARAEVEATNAAFYSAFEHGDLDAMSALWWDSPDVVCVHPGNAPVRGFGPVSRSWALVMAQTAYIQFVLTDVEISLHEGVASLTCTENVLTGDAGTGPHAFGGATAVATNVFVRTGEGWRMWLHHASPVLSSADEHE